LLSHPLVIKIGYRGIRAIVTWNGDKLLEVKHMKSYDGLLASSYIFVMQLVVLCQRIPIGDSFLFTINIGKCELSQSFNISHSEFCPTNFSSSFNSLVDDHRDCL
jgi:hypothetical protein